MNEQQKIAAIFKEANSLNLESLYDSLDTILNAYGDIIQSMYEFKPKLEVGEVYLETLIIKMIITSNSVLQLSKGSEISTLNHPKKNDIIDRSSIYTLTRSIIELFLTLEYLYFNDKEREEQIFRYNLWRISGFKSRQNLGIQSSKFKEKLEREKKEIDELKSQIKLSPYYLSLKKQDLWKLDNFGLPRVFSWSSLINFSVLRSDFISKSYSLYSNYAHSEFISVMQINEGRFSKHDSFNISTTVSVLNLIRILNCVSIKLVKEKFECANNVYNNLNDELRFSLEFWSKSGMK